MSPTKYWKCYFGCEMDGIMHRFPSPVHNNEKFKLWVKVLDTNMSSRDAQYIYNNLRLCDKHFDPCFHTPSRKLTRNAIPTLLLGQPEKEDVCSQPILATDSETLNTSNCSQNDLQGLNRNERQMQKHISKLRSQLNKYISNNKMKNARNLPESVIRRKKKLKLDESSTAKNIAIAEYFTAKKQFMDAKLQRILLNNEKLRLETEKLKMELQKLKHQS